MILCLNFVFAIKISMYIQSWPLSQSKEAQHLSANVYNSLLEVINWTVFEREREKKDDNLKIKRSGEWNEKFSKMN